MNISSFYKRCLSMLLLCYFSWNAQAQLFIDNSYTAQELVEEILIGNGVEVSNVTVGAGTTAIQLAAFTNSNPNLQLQEGILLSTGYATDASIPGFNNATDFTSGSVSCGLCIDGDADLTVIAQQETNDAAVIEFDFIPEADTLRFRYVFASEEYNEYTCSEFNDVFAFFISGMGFTGAENIALIPNTDIPVAINTVNNGAVGDFGNANFCDEVAGNGSLAYSNLFINNEQASGMQFDGFTVVLEAIAVVTPCETYHIKLAIADAFDGLLDSGVFLEANSFSSGVIAGTVVSGLDDNAIANASETGVEGCNDINLTISLPQAKATNTTLALNVFGTATNGVDYNTIPSSVTIPAGQTSTTLTITPVNDGITEGTETILVELETSVCGLDTIVMYIAEENVLSVPTVTCLEGDLSTINFGWSASSGATGYEISIDGGATWITPNGTLSHQITGLNVNESVTIMVLPLGGSEICGENGAGVQTCSTIDCSGFDASSSSTLASCDDSNDGSLTLSASGGVAPFSYSLDGGMAQASPTFSNLLAGTYTTLITDANNCMKSLSVMVNSPPALIGTSQSIPTNCSGTNGQLILSATGGTGPYSYALNGANQTNGTFTGLSVGSYIAVVTDANSCTYSYPSAVTMVDLPDPFPLNAAINPPNCFGFSDGSITLNPTVGTAPFNFVWSTGGMTSSINNLAENTYSVTVTDADGCESLESYTLDNPPVLEIQSITPTNITCFGAGNGIITVEAIGGTGNLSYTWLPNVGNTATINNLSSGTYFVTVTDVNGCSTTDNANIVEPSTLLVDLINTTDATCFDGANGTANVVVSGGVPPYTYLWNNGATTTNISNLDIGNYVVLITDNSGCSISSPTVTVNEPTAITTNMTEQGVSCFEGNDGEASVTITGGTPLSGGNYTIEWETNPPQTGATAFGLTGGQTYTVNITDANNCLKIDSITISQPTAINIAPIISTVSCFGGNDGTISITASGGTPPYTYQWGNNANNATTTSIENLIANTYTILVTDANSCTESAIIEVIQPTLIETSYNIVDVLCKGDSTGLAEIITTGGTPPYTYFWDDAGQNSTLASIQNLAAGIYVVTVTDANACIHTRSLTIEEPATKVFATTSVEDVSCFEGQDGVILVDASGGTPPYSYSVDGANYIGSPMLVGLKARIYTVYTKDFAGCIFETTATVSEPPELLVEVSKDTLIEWGDSTMIESFITPIGTNVQYSWTPSIGLSCDDCPTPYATPEERTQYYLTVTDENGCMSETDIIISIHKNRYVYVANAFSPNGDETNDIFYVQGGRGTTKVNLFRVYDRWGELIFERRNTPLNDPSVGWDGTYAGKSVNPGVFAWYAEVLFEDGARILYQGNVTIIK